MICQSFGIIWVFVVLANCFSIGFALRAIFVARKTLQAAEQQRKVWLRLAERLR
jgi:hypothetical protein